jgi:hypothetical protein
MAKRELALALLAFTAAALRGQAPCASAVRELTIVTPRARLDELQKSPWLGAEWSAAGAECSRRRTAASAIRFLSPAVRVTYLAGVPDPRDQGAAWNGRGLNLFARTGVAADLGFLHVVAAPNLWFAQNRAFDFVPGRDTSRSGFASPFYAGQFSMDLPTRFGVDRERHINAGESAAWLSAGPIDIGASSASQRWGPGLRGGLLLGADAPGIPRVFARTRAPIQAAGAWTLSTFYGVLSESRFFDRDTTNDRRSIAAALVGWSPSDTSAFAVGLAHAEMWNGKFGAPRRHTYDQLNTVFARARFPDAGMRAWLELGRQGPIPTLGDFAAVPSDGLAYEIGLERATAVTGGTLVTTLEFANLEQPTDVHTEPTQDFYTSRIIAQGWTQRGIPLGYATGPGSQSLHLGADWVGARWSGGVFADRVRWNEDALFREFLPNPVRHDVSLTFGVRAGAVVMGREIMVSARTGKRLNFQFQNGLYIPGFRTVDVPIPMLSLSISPITSRQ